MIFEDISFLENIKEEELLKYISSNGKRKSPKRLFRSNMMVNPLNLKHLNKIDEVSADMVTLNLEDGVAKERKREALYKIAVFLSNLKSSDPFIVVRINPLDEGGLQEIEFLNRFSFEAVRISKVKSPFDVKRALEAVSLDKEIHLSLETKEAFCDIKSLKIDRRVTVANLGILDLLNSLSLPQSILKLNNPTIDYILSKFLIDCKSSEIYPFSFMYQDYKNIEEFRKWCLKEKEMGYSGKACLGPLQVEVANEVFGFSKERIKRAKYIVERFEKMSKKGINGFMDEKIGFIDEPIYKDALFILESYGK